MTFFSPDDVDTDQAESEQEGQDFEDDETDQDESGVAISAVNGVFWNNSHWDILSHCSNTAIPRSESSACKKWKIIRQKLSAESKSECASPLPKDCSTCGYSSNQLNQENIGVMLVHTSFGTVQRTLIKKICPRCNTAQQFDPSQECLHTIGNNKHAGNVIMKT